MKRPLLSVLCLTAVLTLPLAHADSDQDRARAAVQAGQVLEVELEQEDGRWVYEVKLLQAGGRLLKLEIDAASGDVLQRRERGRDHGRH